MKIEAAFELLAKACLENRIPVPTKVVFPKGGVQAISRHFKPCKPGQDIPSDQLIHTLQVTDQKVKIGVEDESPTDVSVGPTREETKTVRPHRSFGG